MAEYKKEKVKDPVKTQFFRIGAKASIFFDPITGLKVTKTKPGKLTKKENLRISEAYGSGHIVRIEEKEYDAMMAQHEKNILANNKVSAAKAALRNQAKRGSKGLSIVEIENEEEDEEEEEEEETTATGPGEPADASTGSDDEDEEEEEDDEDEEEEEEEKPKGRGGRGRGK
jgi:hypothetical protein